MPTFRIGEWLLEAPAIYRVPKLEGDFLAPISPGSQPLMDLKKQVQILSTILMYTRTRVQIVEKPNLST